MSVRVWFMYQRQCRKRKGNSFCGTALKKVACGWFSDLYFAAVFTIMIEKSHFPNRWVKYEAGRDKTFRTNKDDGSCGRFIDAYHKDSYKRRHIPTGRFENYEIGLMSCAKRVKFRSAQNSFSQSARQFFRSR